MVVNIVTGKYERDESQPSVETAKKIADAFDVTLDYLVDEDALFKITSLPLNKKVPQISLHHFSTFQYASKEAVS